MLTIIQEALISSIQREIRSTEDEISATFRGKKAHSQEVVGNMANKVKELNKEKIEILSLISKLRHHVSKRE
jgi:hypothetical protein